MRIFFALFIGVALVKSAAADCYEWPLRADKGGNYAYDGDTIYIHMTALPAPISKMSVRVRGLDTPEIKGRCPEEKRRAAQARDEVRRWLANARNNGEAVLFCAPEWGRYGGRVVATVNVKGRSLADHMINNNLGRVYDGRTKRAGWCE